MEVHVNLTWCQKLFYHLARFVGLSPFILNNDEIHPVTLMGKVQSLILIGLTASWMWYYPLSEFERNETTSTGFLAIVTLFAFFGVSTCASLYIFSFRSEKLVDIIRRIIAAENGLRELEMGKIDEVNFTFKAVNIVAVNIIVVGGRFYQFVNESEWSARSSGVRSALIWIGGFLLLVHHVNVIIIFGETMKRIGKYFELLNEKLRHVPSTSDDSQGSPIFVMGKKLKTGDREFQKVQISLGRIEKLRKLHHELKGLVDTAIDLFETPIILTIGYLFSQLLTSCYETYRDWVPSDSVFNDTTSLSSLIPKSTLDIIIVTLELLLIAQACSSACDAVRFLVETKTFTEPMPSSLSPGKRHQARDSQSLEPTPSRDAEGRGTRSFYGGRDPFGMNFTKMINTPDLTCDFICCSLSCSPSKCSATR